MKPSSRLEKIPPYAFAQLERKIAEKRQAGVDVISLGIGDPDRPTPPGIIPAIGAKEAIFNLNLAFLDPGDYALASDPGYPVYTGGPWLAGAEPVLMALEPELGFTPDLGAIDEDVARRSRLMYLNYPNNPTGALAPDGFFERVVEFARAHQILVV